MAAGTQTYLNAYSPTIPGCPQGHFHPGIDYSAASGTSVMSPVAGSVSAVGGSFGTLAVKVGTGADRLLFMHMSSFEVKVGQIIKVGQLLGKSGSVGTKDAHLHVEARTGKDNGACYFPSKSAIGVNKSPTSIVR